MLVGNLHLDTIWQLTWCTVRYSLYSKHNVTISLGVKKLRCSLSCPNLHWQTLFHDPVEYVSRKLACSKMGTFNGHYYCSTISIYYQLKNSHSCYILTCSTAVQHSWTFDNRWRFSLFSDRKRIALKTGPSTSPTLSPQLAEYSFEEAANIDLKYNIGH